MIWNSLIYIIFQLLTARDLSQQRKWFILKISKNPDNFKDKLINDQTREKEKNKKKITNCVEISEPIITFPKDIAALVKRSVLPKVNSQGSGR